MLKPNPLFHLKRLKSVLVYPRQTFKRELCFIVGQTIKALPTFMPTKADHVRLSFCQRKYFHTSYVPREKKKDEVEEYDSQRSLLYYSEFARSEKKDKKAFMEVVRLYQKNAGKRSGHVEFIKAALHHLKEFGVHRDLETYKKLVDVLPKGVYISSNKFLSLGMYFPRQQYVIMDLLRHMGKNGVAPDLELGEILRNIFGEKAQVTLKFRRMFYWSLKWKNKSPFPLPRLLPSSGLELAKLAIERITSVDLQTEVSIFQTAQLESSIDKTWIVSGQSPKQKKLLEKHPKDIPVVVEGGDLVWLQDKSISYFVLKADGEPLPFKVPSEDTDDISNLQSPFFNPNYVKKEETIHTVHEQDDGIIYAVCATGTSSRDSLLSWIRILQNKGNPVLADLPVLFRIKSPETLPATFTEELVRSENI